MIKKKAITHFVINHGLFNYSKNAVTTIKNQLSHH